jgi:hypothetical protein
MARADSSLALELIATSSEEVSLAGYLTLLIAFCTLMPLQTSAYAGKCLCSGQHFMSMIQ